MRYRQSQDPYEHDFKHTPARKKDRDSRHRHKDYAEEREEWPDDEDRR